MTHTTTALSVLGADSDGGGESNLTYTWAATTIPSGASAPTYSANGANASKSTVATFTQVGAYTFTVTITDAGGLSTTSSVNVTVSQLQQPVVYTWDAGASGHVTDGSGTWSTSGSNWWTGSSDVVWPNHILSGSNTDVGVIGNSNGTAGTITVSGSANLNALVFNAPSSGNYTLSSGTLGVGGATPVIAVNRSATISTTRLYSGAGADPVSLNVASGQTLISNTAVWSGTAGGFSKDGAGTLSIAGGNTASHDRFDVGASTGTGGGGATFAMNSGTMNVTTTFFVLSDAGTTNASAYNQTGGTFNLTASAGIVLDSGGSAAGSMNISGGTFNQLGAASLNSVGYTGATGPSVTISGTGVANFSALLNLGHTNMHGTVTLGDSGVLNLSSGIKLGEGSGSTGTWTQTGGTASFGSTIYVGYGGSSTWTQTGGSATAGQVNLGNGGATGSLTITGGTFTQSAGSVFYVGANTSGNSTLIVSGSAAVNLQSLIAGNAAGGSSIVNLNGGLLSANSVARTNGTSTFNFNGGTLQSATSSATFMTGLTNAKVLGGGVIIDTQTYNITIAQALLSGTTNDGGLTKQGSGTLTLTAANTYNGATGVNNGTLAVNGAIGSGTTTVNSGATLAGSGTTGAVAVLSGGTLAPGSGGIGTLNINGPLSLAGASIMEINHTSGTSDTVQGISTITFGGTLTVNNLAGTLAAGDTFTLFSAGTYSGNFSSINLPSLTPGLLWNTSNLTVNGSITVVSQVVTSILVAPATAGVGSLGAQQFTATGYDQVGAIMVNQPTFSWSNIGGGSVSGSGMYSAPYASGAATVTAASGSASGLAGITVTNAAPTVAANASAETITPNGVSDALSVLGDDSDGGGESNLAYTWAATTLPPGAASPTFSANGSNAAKNTVATFSQLGAYTFTVTITDAGGLSTTSSVDVTVEQGLTSIVVAPATASLTSHGTQLFSATGYDQFGGAMTAQPSFTWSNTGSGSVDGTGLYTAGYASGTATVTASSDAVSGTASVTVTDATPTVATAASATPSVVTGTTTALSVLGADSDGGGEASLTYTWAATTLPSGAPTPTFSANGTNASKNSTATFTTPGAYTFTVTIMDAGGLSTTSSVNVTKLSGTYTWDAGAAGLVTDGSGTWNTSGTNWWNSVGGNLAWPNNNLSGNIDVAIVGSSNGTAGTVTVSGSTNLNAIVFNAPGSGNYVLASGTLAFGGATPSATVNTGATINTTALYSGGSNSVSFNVAAGQTLTSTSSVWSGTAGGFSKDGAGTLTVIGGNIATHDHFDVGASAGSAGGGTTFAMNSGTMNVSTGYFVVDENSPSTAIYSQTGGTVNFTSASKGVYLGSNGGSGTGTMNISGGTFNVSGAANNVFGYNNANGVLNMSGTGALNLNSTLELGHTAGYAGTVNLNGGTLQASKVFRTSGVGVVNFNGGTLLASTGNASFLSGLTSANVLGGGAIINDGGFAITIAQALLSGTANDGGLTKSGTGTLTLTGSNTYAGATTVNGGTLSVIGSVASSAVTVASGGTLAGTGTTGAVSISSGGTLAPGSGGIGTLSLSSTTLSLSGTTAMEINQSSGGSDKVQGISTVNYGGTLNVTNLSGMLAAGNAFTLFSASTYSGTFATLNLPTLSAGLVWNTSNLAVNGSIAVTGTLPSGWSGSDIGSVGVPGGSSYNGATYTVNGSGTDIGGTADAFQFGSQTLSGDGEIRARVASQTNTNAFAKAGVMMRDGSGAGAVNALVALTPGHGLTFQSRAVVSGSTTVSGTASSNTAPNNWVRLTRSDTLISAYVSSSGTAWTQIGTVTLTMTNSISVGLAVTSDSNSTVSTATFDNVSVTPFPSPWVSLDIGSPGVLGSAEYYNGAYTGKGAGNVSSTADNFHFLYQSLSGDGQLSARISALQNTGTNARVGVMIRNALTSDSQYAFMGVDGSGNYQSQCRTSTGGSTSTTTSGSGTPPNVWVEIVRSGNLRSGYKSSDGSTWTLVNSTTVTMGTNIYVGFVGASGTTTTLNTSVFDNMNVVP